MNKERTLYWRRELYSNAIMLMVAVGSNRSLFFSGFLECTPARPFRDWPTNIQTDILLVLPAGIVQSCSYPSHSCTQIIIESLHTNPNVVNGNTIQAIHNTWEKFQWKPSNSSRLSSFGLLSFASNKKTRQDKCTMHACKHTMKW